MGERHSVRVRHHKIPKRSALPIPSTTLLTPTVGGAHGTGVALWRPLRVGGGGDVIMRAVTVRLRQTGSASLVVGMGNEEGGGVKEEAAVEGDVAQL